MLMLKMQKCMKKCIGFSMLLHLYSAEISQTHGISTLLLLEDYINTSIHTYPVFARRINIVQRIPARRTVSSYRA